MSDEMTVRDHFAAAALTGLLASGDINVDPSDSSRAEHVSALARRWADAVLRERERKNHDAAPAARANAESVAPQPTACDRAGNPPSRDGTGNISESVYAHLRPELENEPDRSQPVKGEVSDRSKPINDERLAALEQLSALDQELEREHGLQNNPMIKARHNNEST